MDLSEVLRFLSPPCCVACRSTCAGSSFLCGDCVGRLNAEPPVWGDPPPGLVQAVSSFSHEGVAASLLRAFKFGRMPGLCPLLAGFMAEHFVAAGAGSTVVPVPPAAMRRRLRGFDPVGLLADGVCGHLGCDPPRHGVIRRLGRTRQRGRGRQERLRAPPEILPAAALHGPVLLVDDVITTGATVTACAAALERCGAGPITALSFTRRV